MASGVAWINRELQIELEAAGASVLKALLPADFGKRTAIDRFVSAGKPDSGELLLQTDVTLRPGTICRFQRSGSIQCDPSQLNQVLNGAPPEQRRTFLVFVVAHELGHYIGAEAGDLSELRESTSTEQFARQLNLRLPEIIERERKADDLATRVLLRLVPVWAQASGSHQATRALTAGHLRSLVKLDTLAADPRRDQVPLPASAEYARWHAQQMVCELSSTRSTELQFPGTHPHWSSRVAAVSLALAGQRPGAQGCTGVPAGSSSPTMPAGLVGVVGPILGQTDCQLAQYDEELRNALQSTLNAFVNRGERPACGAAAPVVESTAPSVVAEWTKVPLSVEPVRAAFSASGAGWEFPGKANATWAPGGKLIITHTESSMVATQAGSGPAQGYQLPCPAVSAITGISDHWAICEEPLRVLRWNAAGTGAVWTLEKLGEAGDTVSGGDVRAGALLPVSSDITAAVSTPNGDGFLFRLPGADGTPTHPEVLPPWRAHQDLRNGGPLRLAPLDEGVVGITDSEATLQVHYFSTGVREYRRALGPDKIRQDKAMVGVDLENIKPAAPVVACGLGAKRVLCLADDGEVFVLTDEVPRLGAIPAANPISNGAICEREGSVYVLVAIDGDTTLRQLGASSVLAAWPGAAPVSLECRPSLLAVVRDMDKTYIRIFGAQP